ncbi:SHOCT domain-containing protein [Ligilactobacillus ceti]|uniref:SHOCT domain-containing protein n=1 Tax=Ligilactobacillus ceti TaxID=395085 RepID=UPI0004866E6D|nr:SHOCT domain-containing protein [Ligilactobacillus ceti]
MKNVKECIDAEMNYRLASIFIDYLYHKEAIDKKELNRVRKKLKKKYNPPTKRLEGLSGKRNN